MPKDPGCAAECDRRLQDKTLNARKLFDSLGSVYYHNTAWLNEVLAQARNEYDACLAQCPDLPEETS